MDLTARRPAARLPRGLRAPAVRTNLVPVGLVIAGTSVLLGGLVVLYVTRGIQPMFLLGEPALLAGRWYRGAVAELAILAWAIGGAFLVLAGSVRGDHTGAFRALGVLTLGMSLDDRFAVHEFVLASAGVPEPVTLGVIAAFVLLVAWRWGDTLLDHPDALGLVVGVGFLGLSFGLDLLADPDLDGIQAVEEGLKVLGIACWTLFATRALLRRLREGPT